MAATVAMIGAPVFVPEGCNLSSVLSSASRDGQGERSQPQPVSFDMGGKMASGCSTSGISVADHTVWRDE